MYTEHLIGMVFGPHIFTQDGGAMVLQFQERSLQYPQDRNGSHSHSGCDRQNLSPNALPRVSTCLVQSIHSHYD